MILQTETKPSPISCWGTPSPSSLCAGGRPHLRALSIASAWGGPGSTAHSKMPLETLSTNLQTVQCVSWELHPASKALTTGQWRVQVQDQTSKLGSDQSRPTSKHIRKHHHTPHTPSLGQIWNTKIYWHHCIDPGWERIIMWTKVAISQNSPRRGEMHTEKELFILIFTADAIWEEIWSNVFVNMSWVITG